MCGIAGIINNTKNNSNIENFIKIMNDTIVHRGPDNSGIWIESDYSAALSHRRLSIIDLSNAGNQPMISKCSRFVISFNGEIYNWRTLKKELELSGFSKNWHSDSDTEVLLECIVHLGLEKTLNKLRGMFAFALYDKKFKFLVLVRDRIGQKPIYYSNIDGKFIFASELKALNALYNKNFTIDKFSLSLMLKYGYIPSPRSIFNQVYKLPPGHYIKIEEGKFDQIPRKWWDFNDNVVLKNNLIEESSNDIDELDKVLDLAVKEQMIADVPVGALLSGGIDSSLIVAKMQKLSKKPIMTFTASFDDREYNEAQHAKKIANYLGTNHTELEVNSNDALNIIPELPKIFDEPFGDSSQIPSMMICKLISKHVKVCLSGDAGDEFFAGYNRYIWLGTVSKFSNWLPQILKNKISYILKSIPARNWNIIFNLNNILSLPKLNNPGDKIHKLSELISASNEIELYDSTISQWRGKIPIINLEDEKNNHFHYRTNFFKNNFVESMMLMDIYNYLPDDILVKVDRASMANSLETRIPFLDERLMSLAWKIPLNMKIKGRQGKWILQKLLEKYIPTEFINRPKQGFSIPIEYWLRNSLRDWAEDLLSEKSLKESGLLEYSEIRSKWHDHLNGKNNHHALWNVLMFQSWYRQWMQN